MFPVGSLLAVLGLLPGRPATVRPGNVLLLLGLGFHLSIVRIAAFAAPSEVNAVLEYQVKIVHDFLWNLVMGGSGFTGATETTGTTGATESAGTTESAESAGTQSSQRTQRPQ